MQRQGFSKLYARFVSLQRTARNRVSVQAKTATSASPLLVYSTAVLVLLLAILEIDLYRDELRALGLIAGEGYGSPSLLGP